MEHVTLDRDTARSAMSTLVAAETTLKIYAPNDSALIQSVLDELLELRREIARQYNAR